MKNLFRSKLFIGAVCVVLAAVIAFVGIPALNRQQAATKQVLKLTTDVPAGTLITAAAITSAEVGAYGLPEGILEDPDAALGMVAGADLFAGELLWSDRLITEEEYKALETSRSLGLSYGQRLVAVHLPSASAGIAGILRGGSVVDVYEFIEEKDEEGEVRKYTKLLQGSMLVYDVLNSSLESMTDLDEQMAALEEGEEDPAPDYVPVYVVFRCSDAESRELIRLERLGTMHLVLRKTGA